MKTADELYQFLDAHKLAIISTVNQQGLPNAALIGFGQTKDLELLFGTDTRSRKYQNLAHDPHVAFTIGGETAETIQYEGVARELSESELDIVRENYWTKNPYAEKNHQTPTGRYFMVTPTWIRHTNVATTPWDITELHF